ncbi:MAG: hypothetical protein HY718_20765 [Planctomycetes bacterium]|nr:hypothetical protein [Planctomycetota bacterium]
MAAPVPIAMIVCDDVYKDMSSGKTALIGLFNNISASKFPATHGRCCVFVTVTDVRPETEFRLRVVHSETEHVVVEAKGPAPKQTTPLQVCDFCFQLAGMRFPEPGLYFVEFWGNDKLLFQRPLRLIDTGKPQTTG